MDKARELQRRFCQAFEEYFGLRDPVFQSPRECEENMNAFLEWYSFEREAPGRGKTPAQLYLERHGEIPTLPKFNLPREVVEAGEEGLEVGIVYDEVWGFYILPRYGEVKKIFAGDYLTVPDHGDLLRALMDEEEHFPPFLIKRLAEEHPEKAVEAFSSVYGGVKRLEDLFKLFEENRSDWEDGPRLSVVPVKW